METSIKLASYGTFGLHAAINPAGTWSFVGSVPPCLLVEKSQSNGIKYMGSPCFATAAEAVAFFENNKPA